MMAISGLGLRFDVLDVVDRRGQDRSLTDDDAGAHLLGRRP